MIFLHFYIEEPKQWLAGRNVKWTGPLSSVCTVYRLLYGIGIRRSFKCAYNGRFVREWVIKGNIFALISLQYMFLLKLPSCNPSKWSIVRFWVEIAKTKLSREIYLNEHGLIDSISLSLLSWICQLKYEGIL